MERGGGVKIQKFEFIKQTDTYTREKVLQWAGNETPPIQQEAIQVVATSKPGS